MRNNEARYIEETDQLNITNTATVNRLNTLYAAMDFKHTNKYNALCAEKEADRIRYEQAINDL